WARGRHETYLCFVVKRRIGPNSLSFDFGHLRNRSGCHVEVSDGRTDRTLQEKEMRKYSKSRHQADIQRNSETNEKENFFYCWQTFVARRESRFKAWDGLHQNSVRLSRKLKRILQRVLYTVLGKKSTKLL
uniref:Activation-induced cytidine deaminase n=1 Tax=Astyanax mexicanus TaxID=7994 RepID=A0A8B9RMB2_ASTMX